MSEHAPPNTSATASAVASLLAGKATVPQHVVYRAFPTETVVLNLETGRYHGLNATAGRMLEALGRAETGSQAAVELAAAYEQPVDVLEADLYDLCCALLERGLIEVDGP